MSGRFGLSDTSLVPDSHLDAMGAAARRIVPLRRAMSIEDAEDIVRMEFERHGIHLSARTVKHHAKALHAKPLNPWLHPIWARAAGWTWSWRPDGSA
jgi:hypothetical protein